MLYNVFWTICYSIISNLLPKPELEVESGATPKKKRKERSKDEKIPEANTDNHTQSFPEKKCMKADKGADNVDQDLHMGNEHNQRSFHRMLDRFLSPFAYPIHAYSTEFDHEIFNIILR